MAATGRTPDLRVVALKTGLLPSALPDRRRVEKDTDDPTCKLPWALPVSLVV